MRRSLAVDPETDVEYEVRMVKSLFFISINSTFDFFIMCIFILIQIHILDRGTSSYGKEGDCVYMFMDFK